MVDKTQLHSDTQTGMAKRSSAVTELLAAVLIQAELTQWESIEVKARGEELKFMDERFHDLLNELYDSANACVDWYKTFSQKHTAWRRGVIIVTSIVAVTNLLAANREIRNFAGGAIPVLAAVLAVVLTMLASLESFYNAAKKAQGYRESRELFLDAARDFDWRWNALVRPFVDTPQACVNAAELYRQLVAKDAEIRAKYEELTRTPEGSKKEDKGSKQ